MKGERLGGFEEFTLLESKRVYTVTPSGLRTARNLHGVRERPWNAIAEGGRS